MGDYACYERRHRTLVAHCYECPQCAIAKRGGGNYCETGWPFARAWLTEWLPFPDGTTALERAEAARGAEEQL